MRVLVTGATGNVGRLVVDALLARGAAEVRALTVDPVAAALPPEVEVFRGYLGRPESVSAALAGVDRMYLAPLPRTAHRVVTMAARAGVQRVVDLAGPPGNHWHGVEVAVESSGIPWTHLDAGEFMTNTLLWAGQIRRTGVVREAYPTAASAPIAMADIAAVAAAALLEAGHVGRAYALTGPETLTRTDLVRQIGAALGRNIPFVEVTHDEAVALHRPALGEFAEWYVAARAKLAASPQPALPTVAEVTGRPATTFARWCADHVAHFR